MWKTVIGVMQLSGHEVIIVTMRDGGEENIRTEEIPTGCVVYYTDREAKEAWCLSHNIHVDIWIEDSPIHLLSDAA